MIRVLFIDDNEAFLRSTVPRLEMHDCEVVTASTIEQAFQRVRDKTAEFDIAIVDMVMGQDPEGGLKVLDEIRSTKPQIRNIVFTAFANDPNRSKSANRGILAYLDKGTPFDVLLSFLQLGYTERYGEAFQPRDGHDKMWALGMPPEKEELSYFSDVPLPRFKEDEVVVKTRYLGVCGTDVEYFTSGRTSTRSYPIVEFHEAVGEVVAVGRDVQKPFRIGDWVVPMVRRCQKWSGKRASGWNFELSQCDDSYECDYYLQAHTCPKHGGYLSRGTSKYHGFGSEYFSDSAQYLVKIHDLERDKLDRHCVLTEPVSVAEKAVRLINERRGVRVRDRILIAGIGPIGLFCTALLSYRFPGHDFWIVDLVKPNHHKVRMLKSHFGGRVKYRRVRRRAPWPKDLLKDKFDILIDATGDSQNVFPKMFSAIRPQGILVLLGFTGVRDRSIPTQVDSSILDAVVTGGIQIIGSVCASKSDMRAALSFMANECSHHFLNDIIHPRKPLIPKTASKEIKRLRRSGDYVKIIVECS